MLIKNYCKVGYCLGKNKILLESDFKIGNKRYVLIQLPTIICFSAYFYLLVGNYTEQTAFTFWDRNKLFLKTN